jgi:hypothetical protein
VELVAMEFLAAVAVLPKELVHPLKLEALEVQDLLAAAVVESILQQEREQAALVELV